MPTCRGKTRNGLRCQRTVTTGFYCHDHTASSSTRMPQPSRKYSSSTSSASTSSDDSTSSYYGSSYYGSDSDSSLESDSVSEGPGSSFTPQVLFKSETRVRLKSLKKAAIGDWVATGGLSLRHVKCSSMDHGSERRRFNDIVGPLIKEGGMIFCTQCGKEMLPWPHKAAAHVITDDDLVLLVQTCKKCNGAEGKTCGRVGHKRFTAKKNSFGLVIE